MTTPVLPLLNVIVAAKAVEALDIVSVELLAAPGSVLPPFSAGAHVDVHLPGGWVRSYSLCNDPAESGRYLLAVQQEPNSRGGSRAVHADLHVGQALQITPPRNHFPLHDGAAGSLLMAGGIGVTPMLAMAEHLHRQGAAFELHYCTRSRERTAFVPRLQGAAYADRVHHHIDAEPATALNIPALLATALPATHLYVCGPKGFMDAVMGAARAAGWPEAQLHVEYFSAEPTAQVGDVAFEVELASTGRVVRVAADQTVVQALAAAGVDLPISCEQGVCGTCLTRVIAGQVDHRDLYLTPEEQAANDQFTPCCSRAKGALLVLDL